MRAVGRAPGRRAGLALLLLPLAVAALLGLPRAAAAARGGPDALGYTWADQDDGCPTELPVFTPAASSWADPVSALGPLPLGFAMPFAGALVSEAFISPTGFLAFSDQGLEGASPRPVLLPDPAPPNHLVAALWRPTPARRVTAESFGDRFVVEWRWDGGPLGGTVPVFLTLHRDGRMDLYWATDRFAAGESAIGYEDAAGGAGTTYLFEGRPVEPDFTGGSSGAHACLTPPALLDCSDPIVVACGASLDVVLPVALPRQASVYGCSPDLFEGNERVVRLDLATPRAVLVSVDLPEADLFRVPAPLDCDEADCLEHGDQVLDYPLLFAGSHHFVVDKRAPGGGDRVRLDVSCEDLPLLGCGEALAGSTLGGPARVTNRPCVGVPLDGPEAHVLVRTAAAGHLQVGLPGAAPGLWVVIQSPAGDCLAAGEGGATHFDAPAGDFVVTVDGAAGAAADFLLEITCGTRLDCASAQPATCSATLRGDTSLSTLAAVSGYACSGLVADGAEEVFLFSNPREQLVTASFLSRQPGQEAFLLSSCDEGDCLFSRLQGGCALLPAGDYLLVVDGPVGSEGAFELAIDCRLIASPGIDLRASALDASALTGDCRGLDVDGELLVTVENDGADAAPPPFDVVAFLDDGSGLFEPGSDTPLGLATVLVSVPPGERLVVPVAVATTLPFRGALLHAIVDPSEAVADLDRGNQVIDSGRDCLGPAPLAEPLSIALEWEWTGSPVEPTFTDVEAVPLVGDLDGDGRPEILFAAQECCGGPNTGTLLRAVSGADGAELWSAAAPEQRLTPASAQVLADLDGDGRPEIVGQSLDDPGRLVAIDAAGGLLWSSDPLPLRAPFDTWGGAPVAGDLDGDGLAEVAFGPSVVDAFGRQFWTPELGGSFGAADGGPVAVIVDVDGDGLQEVVAGPTAYTFESATRTGRILWTNPDVPDGYAAVAELDGDLAPEILIAAHYTLHALDGDTGNLLWSIELPRGGGAPCGGFSSLAGGPPTVADLDGDGRVEILAMSADWLGAFRADGSLFWSAPAIECSSGITSATVFDLDGDSRPEVVFKDQEAVRILSGTDGSELLSVAGTSGTAREMPIVADVDADGQAEIVVVENRLLGGSGVGLAGIRVFGSGGAPWIGARAVWNQHAYHVSNVWQDLSLPAPTLVACAPPSPLAEGSFRVQRERPRLGPLGPNLTLTLLEAERLAEAGCRQDIRVRVRVGNGGGAASPDTSVAFYDEDAAGGRRLLATAPLAALAPGVHEDLELVVSVSSAEPVRLRVVADDDGGGVSRVLECQEDDNDCLVEDSDVGGLPPGRPADVGPALRATAHGDPYAPDAIGSFDWSLDAGAPRLLGTGPGEEHYHLRRGLLGAGPPVLALVPGSEPLLATAFDDATPRAGDAELPRVHGYRVFAADVCEEESRD